MGSRYIAGVQRLTAILACACAVACGDPPAPAAIRFLHTFSPAETELFNAVIAERGLTVESSLVPFARGQQVIGEILATGQRCPDLIRIDATWLPGLRAQLVPVPGELASLDWTPEAAALGQQDGAWWGVPQTVDGLLVVRDAALPAPASPSIDDVVAAARAARTPARVHPLGVRVDAYWFVPWLRAGGADLAPIAIGATREVEAPRETGAAQPDAAQPDAAQPDATTHDAAMRDLGAARTDAATRALATFAALFGEVAAPPPAAGSEAPEELRRFRAGEVAYWITGPWQFGELGDASRIAVSPLAGAPRGGQLLVVPTCAARPEQGWRLAAELASVPVATRLAQAFSTIPTRTSALAAAPPLARAAADALRDAVPLPRDPLTPLLFDDLNPALAAVVAKDATPEEAIAGVRRGWQRLAGDAR